MCFRHYVVYCPHFYAILTAFYPIFAAYLISFVLVTYSDPGFAAQNQNPTVHFCRNCQVHVDRLDHHCPFIGNCVGGRNSKQFFAFLLFATASCTFSFAVGCCGFYNDLSFVQDNEVVYLPFLFANLIAVIFTHSMLWEYQLRFCSEKTLYQVRLESREARGVISEE